MNKLHEVVLEHDLTRRCRDVDAELECLAIGHRNSELAIAALDVVEQIIEPLDQVLPACGNGLAEHLRIGEREVRRRERVDILTGKKVDLFLGSLVQSLDAGDRVVQPPRGEQIGLLHVVEQEMLLPVFVAKSLVAFCRLGDRRRRLAHELEHRRLPERRVIPQKVHLRFGQAIGIRQHLGRDLEECLGETKLVGDQRMPAGRLPRQEITEKLGALFRRAGKRFGERYRIVVGCAGKGRFRIGHSKAFDIRSMLAWARVG